MRSCRFDREFPSIPADRCVCKVAFATCRGSLCIRIYHVLDGTLDGGTAADAWWCIEAWPLPTRYVRLWGGKALLRLCTNYGHLDAAGCTNSATGTLYFDRPGRILRRNRALCSVCSTVTSMGIPQHQATSGNCWYSAMCFAMFLNADIRHLMTSHMPADLGAMASVCLDDPSAARRLKTELWSRYAVGDSPDTPPELEGQNGTRQLCILLSQIGIPAVRVFVDDVGVQHRMRDPIVDMRGSTHAPPASGGRHLLILRFKRGAHSCNPRHQPGLTAIRNTTGFPCRYRLFALMIGSEHCGHQVCAATPDMMHMWSACDSDARRYGIGPISWAVGDGPRVWWSMLETMMPVTFFSKGTCNLSPHNRPVGAAEGGEVCGRGYTNVDFLYVST